MKDEERAISPNQEGESIPGSEGRVKEEEPTVRTEGGSDNDWWKGWVPGNEEDEEECPVPIDGAFSDVSDAQALFGE